jgi:hypothetical protein
MGNHIPRILVSVLLFNLFFLLCLPNFPPQLCIVALHVVLFFLFSGVLYGLENHDGDFESLPHEGKSYRASECSNPQDDSTSIVGSKQPSAVEVGDEDSVAFDNLGPRD